MKIFSLLTIILVISGCHRAQCPGYPDKYLNWIPYKQGDSAFFTDGTDTLKLLVNETYKSGTYKQRIVWNLEFPCQSSASAYISGDSYSHQIRINSEQIVTSEEPEMFYNYAISINSNDWSVFNFYVRNNEIATDFSRIPAQLLLSYNNGYKEYTNVLKLEMDTAGWLNPKMIYKLYIAESVGIIQFTETINHKIWSLSGK